MAIDFLLRRWRKAAADPSREQVSHLGKSTVKIGRFTYGYRSMKIHQWDEGANLSIGSFCSLAKGIHIFLGGNHRTDWITTFPFGHIFQNHLGKAPHPGHPATRGDVNIGSDVWIGQRVTILSGVTIGDGAVIGAESVVTRDVAPYSIVAGNPAQLVRSRFAPDIVELLLALKWWDLPLDTIREVVPMLSAEPSVDDLQALLKQLDLWVDT